MNAEQMILLSQKLVMLSIANDQADKDRLSKAGNKLFFR